MRTLTNVFSQVFDNVLGSVVQTGGSIAGLGFRGLGSVVNAGMTSLTYLYVPICSYVYLCTLTSLLVVTTLWLGGFFVNYLSCMYVCMPITWGYPMYIYEHPYFSILYI